MSVEAVRAYLEPFGAADKIKEFTVSSATVALAAEALGCEPARIAKTLSFLVDDAAVLIVTAGDAKVDNAKFKAEFHKKATMLAPDSVEPLTGHKIGGVCPFAVAEGARVYLDTSLRRFSLVYPAAGSASSAIPLTLEELETYSRALAWIDVCKGWQEEA